MSELMRLILGIVAIFGLMLLIALIMSCIVAVLEVKEQKEKEVSRAFERIKQEEGLEYVKLRDLTEEEIQHFKELLKNAKPELVRLESEEQEPEGEWIYNDKLNMFYCKDCGLLEPFTKEEVEEGAKLPNFCEQCGADMRKGGAE